MNAHRTLPLACLALLLASLVAPAGSVAQESDRIWGRILTVRGETHEGFIRWDRNEGAWVDLLDGSKRTDPPLYEDWWELNHPEDRGRERVIEMSGYRISWDDSEPDFASSHESGIRFGHISSLVPLGSDEARVELRSGATVELEGGATDLGTGVREILVLGEGGGVVELEWEDLERVDFSDPPPGATVEGRRLHGTVSLTNGPEFTGYIAWETDQAFNTDTLDWFGSRIREGELPFDRVEHIEALRGSARITLSGGSEMDLTTRVDVDWGRPTIQISDPGLGMINVEWEEVASVRLHPPEEPHTRSGFDGGRRLRGTVVTSDDSELTGWIIWDADEAYSWELLDGSDRRASYDVELGMVAAMERTLDVSVEMVSGERGPEVGPRIQEGVQVTLRDGRTFRLRGSNDVDEGNDGIFVLEDGSGLSPDDPEATWIMVRWDDFKAVRFER